MFVNKQIYALCCLSLVPLQQLSAASKKAVGQPNIILIYCDDLGYGDLGVTGHPQIHTPNIDRMALDGVRFSNYYSASPASTASRYAMMTGKYPARSGFEWVLGPKSEKGIHPNEITQAEALKSKGYKTAIYGKWHLGSTKQAFMPLQNGFDEYVGFPYSNDMIPPKFQNIALLCGNDTIEMNPDQSKLTELYTQKAITFITKNKKEKFFIYLPYAMPHVPLHPGKRFASQSKRGAYGDVVEEIDWYVGEILSTLKKEKLDKNTLVWFISDNGPWIIKDEEGGSAGLFRDGKGSTWEGGVRVPCIAYLPGQIVPQVNDKIVTAMDVYATNLWLGDYQLPENHVTDGVNIASYLAYPNAAEKKDTPYFYFGLSNRLFAVREGKWKLHMKTYSQTGVEYFSGKLPLLFNVEVDPSEKKDLSKQYPEIVKHLQELLDVKGKEITVTYKQ
ncbi:MAG: sulfatase [Tannerellaceae bacterium]